jgi:hypothetical protein
MNRYLGSLEEYMLFRRIQSTMKRRMEALSENNICFHVPEIPSVDYNRDIEETSRRKWFQQRNEIDT